MPSITEEQKLREILELNEFRFYHYMPNSDVVKNDFGYFVKNKAIETYSYVSPTHFGEVNFEDFLDFTFSYFNDGKEYFVVKVFYNDTFRKNSKLLRQRNFITYPIDTSLMSWSSEKSEKLEPDTNLELDLLTLKNVKRWVDAFFDSFSYPSHLRKYITSMVNEQIKNGIEFFVGKAFGKDVSCFCSFRYENFIGLYGVGTKTRFRRQGYARKMTSNYISDIIADSPDTQFCLQAQNNSGAEQLYLDLGFEIPFTQKRFDWDPSTLSVNL